MSEREATSQGFKPDHGNAWNWRASEQSCRERGRLLRLHRREQRIVENRHRSRPASRRAADLVREARDHEAVSRQRFEIVQLLEWQ